LNKFAFILFFLLPISCFARTAVVDSLTRKIPLESISTVYKDDAHRLSIHTLLSTPGITFTPTTQLNFGVSYADYWLKFSLENKSASTLHLYLAMESCTNDSMFFYTEKENNIIAITSIGESVSFYSRKIRHRNPVMEIVLAPHESANYYLSGKGNGQPMNLSGNILSGEMYNQWNSDKSFFTGLIYGILLLIMLLNISFYIATKEKVYITFFLQVLCGWASIGYFDGFIHQYIFPASAYWSNQTIAITLCLTFIFSNIFIAVYYNLKVLSPFTDKAFKYSSYCLSFILLASFIHPRGFNFFIIAMLIMTSVTAMLLSLSVLKALKTGIRKHFFAMLATVSVIFIGSLYQLYFLGIVPDVFLSHYALHIAILLQSVFMALAVNDKFKNIREENMRYQEKLVMALKEYSQNLITTIEEERQRLAVDIHDSLGQNLLVIRNRILLTQKQKKISGEVEEELDLLLHATSETLDEVRTISHNLRPPILNAMGLTASIHSLVDKIKASTPLDVKLNMDDSIDGVLLKKLEINVYRILQESFSNVIKHADASAVTINIHVRDYALLISFADNGIGFDTGTILKGQGVAGIKERVALLNGNLEIHSVALTGTELRIRIKLK
jgi:signal transduction histidine kinase